MNVTIQTSTAVLSSEPVSDDSLSQFYEIFRHHCADFPVTLEVSTTDDRRTQYVVHEAESAESEDEAKDKAAQIFDAAWHDWIEQQ